MLEDSTRAEIAKSLDDLAAQQTWNESVWQLCYNLVGSNTSEDDLVAYVYDDLIHYTGTPLFRSTPRPKDLERYRQEFRDVAEALRSKMSLAEYKKNYE
jgi:hypothetical protein